MNFERVAGTLQRRFAEAVARYEGDIALLTEETAGKIEALTFERDEANRRVDELEKSITELEVSREANSAKKEKS